jgi:hypothetical protein
VGRSAAMTGVQCFCKLGYFHPTAKNGVACIECPDGAVCPGSTIRDGKTVNAQPYPKSSYWASESIITSTVGA